MKVVKYNKNCLWQPCLLMDQNEMSTLYRGPSIDASYQVSYHLAKQFQRKRCFRNWPIRNKNWFLRIFFSETALPKWTDIWWEAPMEGSVLSFLKAECKVNRGPSIDAPYQVSYHLAKRFQRKRCFRNWPIRNKNCLWRPCLLLNQNGMSNSHRGPSIDASYPSMEGSL
jgi:hypothetical protein